MALSSNFTLSDVTDFRTDGLLGAAAGLLPGVTLSDSYLLSQLQAAEAETAQLLKVYLKPTAIFSGGIEPTDAELAALDGGDWDEEPGYDYDAYFFSGERWGYLVLRRRPVIKVSSIKFAYPAPTQTFYAIPHDWIRLDKKAGQVNLVPATSTFTAPLSAFMLQALGGGSTIPFMMQVNYTTGIDLTDFRWAGLLDLIKKKAVLKVIQGAYIPQSGSISADGLSQSQSLDTSKYGDIIQEALYGPKGSNGGYWTAIHGAGLSIAGAVI